MHSLWLPHPACTVAPSFPACLGSTARVSQPCRGQCCCPWAQGAHNVPDRAHPRAHPELTSAQEGEDSSSCRCQDTCLSLTLCSTLRHLGQHQLSEGPLGCWGSRTGPGPSLSCDFRDASRESLKPPHHLPPPHL